jgi:plasmid stability protein
MAQLLVRNLSDGLVKELRRRAASHHRSVEAEHRALLEKALSPKSADFRHELASLRKATEGRIDIPSETLLRETRDER